MHCFWWGSCFVWVQWGYRGRVEGKACRCWPRNADEARRSFRGLMARTNATGSGQLLVLADLKESFIGSKAELQQSNSNFARNLLFWLIPSGNQTWLEVVARSWASIWLGSGHVQLRSKGILICTMLQEHCNHWNKNGDLRGHPKSVQTCG